MDANTNVRPAGVGACGLPTPTVQDPISASSRYRLSRNCARSTTIRNGVCATASDPSCVDSQPVELFGRDGSSTCTQPGSSAIIGTQVSELICCAGNTA